MRDLLLILTIMVAAILKAAGGADGLSGAGMSKDSYLVRFQLPGKDEWRNETDNPASNVTLYGEHRFCLGKTMVSNLQEFANFWVKNTGGRISTETNPVCVFIPSRIKPNLQAYVDVNGCTLTDFLELSSTFNLNYRLAGDVPDAPRLLNFDGLYFFAPYGSVQRMVTLAITGRTNVRNTNEIKFTVNCSNSGYQFRVHNCRVVSLTDKSYLCVLVGEADERRTRFRDCNGDVYFLRANYPDVEQPILKAEAWLGGKRIRKRISLDLPYETYYTVHLWLHDWDFHGSVLFLTPDNPFYLPASILEAEFYYWREIMKEN